MNSFRFIFRTLWTALYWAYALILTIADVTVECWARVFGYKYLGGKWVKRRG